MSTVLLELEYAHLTYESRSLSSLTATQLGAHAIQCMFSDLWFLFHNANSLLAAALKKVPQLKTEDVEELFYGNVLSAK